MRLLCSRQLRRGTVSSLVLDNSPRAELFPQATGLLLRLPLRLPRKPAVCQGRHFPLLRHGQLSCQPGDLLGAGQIQDVPARA